ncbi:NEDD8 activating enzyme [Schizosaccharomyces cryophilus OY26]|uniref:NEDD8-activating enzyme E1 regulatory subunit n=1 Tax=Schizosaccharomyces cryophilus (strain OY26 / ATCC MYA-4695 / CBS 11777 / NBRC 106824 / NRRL Y48691) TaxID=653667 RepID=S9VUP2_SCHCR|nr:NEDD8 activating enzyme [Schizosaccharomyces cryophilus OY26]EPY51513.1 NEDD8 activating enzyme [Schizosaccharomyces cryophilus OY26]
MDNPCKMQKYDSFTNSRQVRIWKAEGQNAIEQSHICLLNANTVGCEALKNTILPGIREFTVIDASVVDLKHDGSNFFVQYDQEGQSRALCTGTLLQQLNPSVEMNYQQMEPEKLIEEDIEFFSRFTIVFASKLKLNAMLRLEAFLRSKGIPLIYYNSIGFVGIIRISVPEYTTVQSQSEVPLDLRLRNPWPELIDHVRSLNVSQMDGTKRNELTYIELLIHYMLQFEALHHRKPENSDDRKVLQGMIRKDINGQASENYEEALSSYWRVFQEYKIPSNVMEVLQDEKSQFINEKSTDFWVMCHSLKCFYEEKGTLPLLGTLPDMHSNTQRYLSIKHLYNEKYLVDFAAFKIFVQRTLQSQNRHVDDIPEVIIKRFCKNVLNIKFLRYRSIQEELESPKHLDSFLSDENSLIPWYFAFRISEQLLSSPTQSSLEKESPVVKSLVDTLFEKYSLKQEYKKKVLKCIDELSRASDYEVHPVSSLVGGIAAQEAIKILTKHYLPLNHTCIFDGVLSKTETFNI